MAAPNPLKAPTLSGSIIVVILIFGCAVAVKAFLFEIRSLLLNSNFENASNDKSCGKNL